ncbi:hypothetical protein EG327_003941 [Venturia inaequalis]|uniref:Uncharacterized protein n=1 Tax=Venturia inaequalis TaxID=5025 RepID=A0A8H3VNN7_VENIN|nr:hypothetical protein EG327_003941 [Venturia inaequalis]
MTTSILLHAITFTTGFLLGIITSRKIIPITRTPIQTRQQHSANTVEPKKPRTLDPHEPEEFHILETPLKQKKKAHRGKRGGRNKGLKAFVTRPDGFDKVA